MLVFIGNVAKIHPNLSDGAKKYQQAFLVPLPGIDSISILVIVLRNANTSLGAHQMKIGPGRLR